MISPPYTFDKLRAATRPELVNEIDRQLCEFETSKASGSDKAVYALNAQILMQEVARKDQSWQANTMIVCTIVITFLTLAITVMTFVRP